MDQQTANKLDRLLADDGLSGPEADAIFERVYATVAREPRRFPTRSLAWTSGGLAAATAVAAGLWMLGLPREASPEFAARGAEAVGPRVEFACTGGAMMACPISAKLVFVVSGAAAASYLSAYAEPLDAATPRVWYFSAEAGKPKRAEPAEGTHVLDQTVLLRGSHRVGGRYVVHAFLADRPLGHAEMLASPRSPSAATPTRARVSASANLQVVER
jgi:hypothetical protein